MGRGRRARPLLRWAGGMCRRALGARRCGRWCRSLRIIQGRLEELEEEERGLERLQLLLLLFLCRHRRLFFTSSNFPPSALLLLLPLPLSVPLPRPLERLRRRRSGRR